MAAREALLASPALGRWLRRALEPLRRAGREGYAPRRASAAGSPSLGAVALLLAAVRWLVGPGWRCRSRSPGPALAGLGDLAPPARATARAVERSLPEVATAVADSLAAGRSLRASLRRRRGLARRAAGGRAGPARRRARPRRADRGRGRGLAARGCARPGSTPSPPRCSASGSPAATSPACCAASPPAPAERDRVAEDARSATAQARFTGLLVVAMPTGGALFAELLQPGFVAELLAARPSAALLALAAALQAGRLRRDPAPQQDRGRLGVPGGGAALIAVAVLLAAAGVWELAGSRGERGRQSVAVDRGVAERRAGRTLAEAALRLRLPERLRARGAGGRVTIGAVLAAQARRGGRSARCSGCSPRRRRPAAGHRRDRRRSAAAGFCGPDALLERAARRRRCRGCVAALPDALDLLAVGAAAGPQPAAGPGGDLDRATPGEPLAAELAVAVAEIECGTPQREAIAAPSRPRARRRLGALAAALERSRRFGSPLAEQLHEQASSLRRDARRRIEEHAARAAPKIQLVVALVLVPSVLLMIVAGLVANSDALFGAL